MKKKHTSVRITTEDAQVMADYGLTPTTAIRRIAALLRRFRDAVDETNMEIEVFNESPVSKAAAHIARRFSKILDDFKGSDK